MREIQHEYEELEGKFKSNEAIFVESKQLVTDVQEQLRQVHQENEKIKQDNFKLQLQTKMVEDTMRELEDAVADRDATERMIRNVTEQPFLPKEEGNSVAVRIQDYRERLNAKEKLARTIKTEEETIVKQW